MYKLVLTEVRDKHDFEYFEQDNFGLLVEKIKKIELLLYKIHETVREYDFVSLQEEIFFFKKVKPLVVQEYIFMNWLKRLHEEYCWHSLYSKGFLKMLLAKNSWIFEEEKEFYRYLKRGDTFNDERYFTRLKYGFQIGKEYGINLDVKVTSSHGFLKAKLRAYEQIQRCCLEYLPLSEVQQKDKVARIIETIGLKWTGTKTEAAELVYALYFSGSIDYGDATVQKLVTVFDAVFQTRLETSIYRDFIDIKNRKKESSKFLNKLISRFNEQLNERFI